MRRALEVIAGLVILIAVAGFYLGLYLAQPWKR